MKRNIVAVVLAIVLIMALSLPAFALTHNAVYEMDGVINFKKQAGHWCNTGAAVKQTIAGSGIMSKVQTVSMGGGVITMNDRNDFVAGATPLTVTTVWELCAPAKYVYERAGETDWVPPVNFIYEDTGGWTWKHPNDKMEFFGYTALTSQIWAVQVQADPGFSGNLSQRGKAAFGGGYLGQFEDTSRNILGIDGWQWWDNSYVWGRFRDTKMNRTTEPGPDYVGNYFNLEQHARTAKGTVRRFIDYSSPHNHSYLMEDMSVVGKSDIKDVFANTNVKAGADVPGEWWKLF